MAAEAGRVERRTDYWRELGLTQSISAPLCERCAECLPHRCGSEHATRMRHVDRFIGRESQLPAGGVDEQSELGAGLRKDRFRCPITQ